MTAGASIRMIRY